MAVTGTATLSCEASGLASGTKTVRATWSITDGSPLLTLVNLASGDNTIAVPASPSTVPTLIVIVPPTTNAQALKLKGAGGDTGVQINTTKPTALSWQTGASFILNAAGIVNNVEINFI